MHDHPRPHGFGRLSPNGKADTAAEHAPGDNRPQFVASKLETVNVGTRYGSADRLRSSWLGPFSTACAAVVYIGRPVRVKFMSARLSRGGK